MENTKNIRVSVSLPPKQVERMDKHAEKLGLSRNAFMQIALAEYMTNKEIVQDGMITQVLSMLQDHVKEEEN